MMIKPIAPSKTLLLANAPSHGMDCKPNLQASLPGMTQAIVREVLRGQLPLKPTPNEILWTMRPEDVVSIESYNNAVTQIKVGTEFQTSVVKLHAQGITGKGVKVLVMETPSTHRDEVIATIKTVAPDSNVYLGNFLNYKEVPEANNFNNIDDWVGAKVFHEIDAWKVSLTAAKNQGISLISCSQGLSMNNHLRGLFKEVKEVLFNPKMQNTPFAQALAKLISPTATTASLTFDNYQAIMLAIGKKLTSIIGGSDYNNAVKELDEQIKASGILVCGAVGNAIWDNLSPGGLGTFILMDKLSSPLSVGSADPITHKITSYSEQNEQLDLLQEPSHGAGTSFSAPYVAATAALMLQLKPKLNSTTITQILTSTAHKPSQERTGDMNIALAIKSLKATKP
jgi:subtilisin family serine protease